jgi:hypothetical protein
MPNRQTAHHSPIRRFASSWLIEPPCSPEAYTISYFRSAIARDMPAADNLSRACQLQHLFHQQVHNTRRINGNEYWTDSTLKFTLGQTKTPKALNLKYFRRRTWSGLVKLSVHPQVQSTGTARQQRGIEMIARNQSSRELHDLSNEFHAELKPLVA